ncbi:MAG TPA: M20/M25/M40 family metallo-hydrolase, partial [Vicinamibacteria bacterium]
TGATDNGSGSAVMMEAMRILESIGARPRRTIRVGLWGGEEQGYWGSKYHVETHYASLSTMALKPAHAKLAAYYNLDNGTGKIRGIYLQGNEAVRPIFEKFLEPFGYLGASTVTTENTSGTDHLLFDAAGLPGFQFLQDPIEYDSLTHHTNMDVYDHVREEDLEQAAVIVASFAYVTAMRDDKLPRKPLPGPRKKP